MEARRPVVLNTRGVLQSVPERLDCVPDRATRENVGWRVDACLVLLPGVRSPGARVGAATCLRSSAGSGGRFECRRTLR